MQHRTRVPRSLEELRRQRGLTRVEVVIIAVVVIGAALVLLPPLSYHGHPYSLQIHDRKNLDSIGATLEVCATGENMPFSPLEGATSVDHFQHLLEHRFVMENIRSSIFVSPVQSETPAIPDENGFVRLTAANDSYTYAARAVSRCDGPVPLASNSRMAIGDQTEGFRNAVNVLFSDGRVRFIRVGTEDARAVLRGHVFPPELIDARGRGPNAMVVPALLPAD